MRVLFVSSGNTDFEIIPFIKSQADSLIKNGIDIEHFFIRGKGLAGYLKNVTRLKKHVRERKYDIIHAHYSFCGWVAVLSRPSIPIVVSYMGSDAYGLVSKNGEKNIRGFLDVASSKSLQPFVDKIIVKSKNIEESIYLKHKTAIVPNGVDFQVFKPMDKLLARQKLGICPDKKIIAFLANPKDPRKNLALLKSALEHLQKNGWELVVPYPVKPEMIPLYINAADVVVLTSYLEGSPNVVKECMACNTPIVATDVGDVREVIKNTEGCHITSFDKIQLANCISSAIEFGGTTKGREAISHLEINHIAKKVIALYNSLLTSKNELLI